MIETIDLTSGMEKFAATPDGGYVIVGNYSDTKTISGNLTSSGQEISITSTRGYDGGYFREYTVDMFVIKLDANNKVSNFVGVGGAGAWREPGRRQSYICNSKQQWRLCYKCTHRVRRNFRKYDG